MQELQGLGSKSSSRLLKTGFVLICILLVAGILTDSLIVVSGAAVFLMVTTMLLGYPSKLTSFTFSIQTVFTTFFLGSMTIWVGPLPVTPDVALLVWVFILWMAAYHDGDGRIPPTKSGRLITVLIILTVVGFFRGILGGNNPAGAWINLRTMMGYLFFFPCMWLLKKRKNVRLLAATVLWASILASIVVITKGFTGGEGVYLRETSGLRVSSRELNVVMIGLLLAGFALWKRSKSVPLIPGLAALLTMGAAILLGQSRALWLAVATGALVAFTAEMGRSGREGIKLGPLLSRVVLLLVFTVGSVAFVSAAGLLSAGDVVARGGGADGGLAGDVSLWARFLSWWEITRTVTESPVTLLTGTGLGYEITYFRPDLGTVVSIPYVDGSFFQLLLNTGLAGMVTMILLYAGGIARSFRLVLNSQSKSDTVLALWLTASFAALLIASLSGSLLTNYRFTCIWAFLFALLETLRGGRIADSS